MTYSTFGNNDSSQRTNDKLWNQVVNEVKSSDSYGLKDQWNARKASRAVQLYKQRGGEYIGRKPSPRNNDLKKWLKEDWTTYNGKPAIQKDENGKVLQVNRYLPRDAWKKLSPAEVGATNRLKRKGFKEGKQFVSNAKAAKKAGQEVRNFEYMDN